MGGTAVQIQTPTPAAWAGGGGGVEKFSPFCGHFLIPHFILSILNIHKWFKFGFTTPNK